MQMVNSEIRPGPDDAVKGLQLGAGGKHCALIAGMKNCVLRLRKICPQHAGVQITSQAHPRFTQIFPTLFRIPVYNKKLQSLASFAKLRLYAAPFYLSNYFFSVFVLLRLIMIFSIKILLEFC